MAWLMHASLTASIVFIFTPQATGETGLVHAWVLAAAMWAVVAAVAAANHRLSLQPLRPRAA